MNSLSILTIIVTLINIGIFILIIYGIYRVIRGIIKYLKNK